MAAPTAPDIDSISNEGLKKAGYSSPSSTQTSRAQDEWLQEIKNDIWLIGRKPKILMAEHVEVLAGGKAQYDFPSGFSTIDSAQILFGDTANDVTGAAAATVTLDSDDETAGEDDVEGTEILIYSGTGKNSMSRCYSYDEDTYIASVSPAWANTPNGTAPVATDTYVLVKQYIPLELRPVAEYNMIAAPNEKGPPNYLFPVGDEDHYGYYYLYPVPDDDYYYGIRFWYYLNIMTLDLASTRMTTLYDRWRNLWVQGIYARQLQDDDDNRASIEMQRYYNMVKDIASLESYGRNIKQNYTGVRA